MDALIKEMIDRYMNNEVTWHEIQDIVEGYAIVHGEDDNEALKQIKEGIDGRLAAMQFTMTFCTPRPTDEDIEEYKILKFGRSGNIHSITNYIERGE